MPRKSPRLAFPDRFAVADWTLIGWVILCGAIID
jgi:hypothetical protein